MNASGPPPPSAAHKRRVRTYLLDPGFQLKYTGLLVGVVLAVMVVLGLVIWRTSDVASSSAELAAAQAERALKESATSAQLLRMTSAMYGADAGALGKTLEEAQAEADRALEKELAKVRDQRAAVEGQRRQMVALLLGGGAGLLALLGVMGIFITHRIVGPVSRLKRLCRQVGTARLNVQVGVRKGDELDDLFDTFRQMTFSLKALQIGRLATLDATIEKATAASADPEVMESLRALRAQLCLGLDKTESLRVQRVDGRRAS